MTVLDLDFVRRQFPSFSDPEAGPWAFFENAGGSYVPQAVVDRMSRYLSTMRVQHGAEYDLSRRATQAVNDAADLMADWINARPDEIVIGPSATQLTYVLAQAMRGWFGPGDEIIVTNQDHECNVGAWRRLAAATGATIREWGIDPETGELELPALQALLNDRTRLVCVTHCSNIVGTINDIPAIARMVHAAGALIFVDGVAYAPHRALDMKALDVDFYVFSLYKTYGPHQALLYGRHELLAKAENQNHDFIAGSVPYHLAPGGKNQPDVAALAGIADYLDAVHAHHFPASENGFQKRSAAVFELFTRQEADIAARLLDYLNARKDIRVIGQRTADPARRAPTISFTVSGRSSLDVTRGLLPHKIAVRNGNFYATRCVEALGLDREDGVVRVSMVHYNTADEVDRLIRALDGAPS
ncbi:cysteine desulfurase-like protein [Oceanibaculum nanhaiense]|uniref:cysteine desulfurase-like protein n=1 Tax=Oceanibaculum nanhaiense TaxID=1909734 RepID=UPI003D29CC99